MAKATNIKCPNCGANLDLEENKNIVTCQYCNADLKIEKDMNDIIEARLVTGTKIAKGVFSYVAITYIFSFIFISLVTISIFFVARGNHSNFDKTKFNSSFTYAAGTKSGTFVDNTIDNVIKSNKENKNHQIYVKYEDYNTKNEDDLISIKDTTENFTYYEVSIDYDTNGYVNLVTIKIKK